MFPARIQSLFGIHRSANFRGHRAFAGLLSAAEIHAVLQRERSRADRSGDRFSLLAFSTNGSTEGRSVLVQTATILKKRLRSTDELGWMEDGRIGIVLPSTSKEGAETLANDVLWQYPAEIAQPKWQVYCYPSTRLPAEQLQPPHDTDERVQSSDTQVYALDSLLQETMPVWKRSIDVVVAVTSLVVLSPLFLILAAAIKITSPGPVLFKQLRGGRGGTPFLVYKFRSMVNGAERSREAIAGLNEQDGPAFKIEVDPRVTPLGRVLRATSIDELPQLWNVLRGEMSLVGPRPLPCDESDACQGWHRRRLEVTPGLTCIWQTSDRRSISFNEWMRMDVHYIRSRSLWQDTKLILATVGVVLRGKRW